MYVRFLSGLACLFAIVGLTIIGPTFSDWLSQPALPAYAQSYDGNGDAERVSVLYYNSFARRNTVASAQIIASTEAGIAYGGLLHTVTIASAAAGTSGRVVLYDTAATNCTSSGSTITSIDTSNGGSRTLTFDAALANGLCVDVQTASPDLTISYRKP